MTEITSQVYDIFHPTPVSLKQLSAMAVSLGIWRYKMNSYRTNDRLSNFRPKIGRNSLKATLPETLVPSVIFEVIYKYVVRFGSSLSFWLRRHYDKVFISRDRSKNEILAEFDDFVCDHYGDIHHTRTAERMMHCSALEECERFRLACIYFFEDHIRLIWPNVRGLEVMNYEPHVCFDQYPQLYYWICYMKNELDKILPTTEGLSAIYELLFNECLPDNRPSVEYFWLRIPLERRLQKAFDLFDRNINAFVKFILQKLNDHQLDEFVESKGCQLMIILSTRIHYHNEGLILPTWKYIKSSMSDSNLTNMVSKMLNFEAGGVRDHSMSKLKHWSFYCSEIWNDINADLKPSIVESVLSRSELFETRRMCLRYFRFSMYRERCVQFLLIILSCASFEQKKTFWLNCWRTLIKGARVEDLHRIIKMCFENEVEIVEFKKNTMANSHAVHHRYEPLLLNGLFDELNALVDFCNPESEAARICKRELLLSYLLSEGKSWNREIIKNGMKLCVFVDNAFSNADLSKDFKNQLMSSNENQSKLTGYLYCESVPLKTILEFIDVFDLTEQTALQIKERMKTYLTKLASDPERTWRRDVVFKKPFFDQFLLWCLGSDEEVATFKRTYSANS